MSSTMQDPTTQTECETSASRPEIREIIGVTTCPHVERPTRTERRRVFWGRIIEKNTRKKEEKRGGSMNGAGAVARPTTVTNRGAGSHRGRGRAGRGGHRGSSYSSRPTWHDNGVVPPTNHPNWFYHTLQYQPAFERDPSRYGTRNCTMLPQFFPAHVQQPVILRHMDLPRSFDNPMPLSFRTEYLSPLAGSEPSTSGVGVPHILLSPCEPATASKDHTASKSQPPEGDRRAVRSEIDLLSICPPSPSIASVDEMFSEDIGPLSESSSIEPSIPDPASSNIAPRAHISEWDGETKIAQCFSEQQMQDKVIIGESDILPPDKHFMDRLILTRKLLVAGENSLLPSVRSQSWTPSSTSSSFPSDCDTIVVEEPEEIISTSDPRQDKSSSRINLEGFGGLLARQTI